MLELQPRDREFSPSGGCRGGAHPAPPTLFLEQTKAQKAENFFFETPPVTSGFG